MDECCEGKSGNNVNWEGCSYVSELHPGEVTNLEFTFSMDARQYSVWPSVGEGIQKESTLRSCSYDTSKN